MIEFVEALVYLSISYFMSQPLNTKKLIRNILAKKDEKYPILFFHYDQNLVNQVKSFKRRLDKKGYLVVETYQGEIEKYVYSGAPASIKEIWDYTAYAATLLFDVGKLVGEIYGIWTMAFQFNHFISSIKSDKDVLLINEIERENNFPLQLCFAVSSGTKADVRLKAISDIVSTVEAVRSNITRYQKNDIVVLSYDFASGKWDLGNPKFYERRYGSSTAIASQRVIKRCGLVLGAEMPKAPYNNFWEYSHAKIPVKAKEHALMFRNSYYQRLENVEDIKRAIKSTGAAQVCIHMYDNFFVAVGGRVSIPSSKDRFIGGHAVCVEGYDDVNKEFLFINSWGKEWGDAGRGYLPYEYVDKYLIEAWGSSAFFDIKLPLRSGISLLRWFFVKKLIKGLFEKKQEKIVRRGQFEDKRRIKVGYEVKIVKSFASKGYLYIINVFDTNNPKQYGAWCHFNLDSKNKKIEIEELVVAEEFQNSGWGKFMISMVENYARRDKIEKIYGFVFLYDAYNELMANFQKQFFTKLAYRCIDDKKSYVGSLFRFEKILLV